MSGGVGDIAKVAVPLALTVATGGAAAPLAAGMTTAGMGAGLASALAPALVGAATGAVGSAITGGDPLTGAALGGIGGGISGSGIMDGVFSSGAGDAASGLGQAGSGAGDAASLAGSGTPAGQGIGGLVDGEILSPAFAQDSLARGTDVAGLGSAAPRSFMDRAVDFAGNNWMPIAGGLGTLAFSGNDSGGNEPIKRDERQPNNVAPLQREQLAIDPNAFYGVGGDRSGFVKANPSTVYLADGGQPKDKSEKQKYRESATRARAMWEDDTSKMAPSAKFVIDRYLKDGEYPGTLSQYTRDEYQDAPVARKIRSAAPNEAGNYDWDILGYANGGAVMPQGIGAMVRGAGDGQSDEIPAMLSDGEYVIPAPVVSALGRGSNDAGAKKLDKMKKQIMAKTYKKAKPPRKMGLGSMMAA